MVKNKIFLLNWTAAPRVLTAVYNLYNPMGITGVLRLKRFVVPRNGNRTESERNSAAIEYSFPFPAKQKRVGHARFSRFVVL